MSIPYRTRCFLKRLGICLLVALLVAAAVTVCWFLWLERYVVYTRDGVVLDFSRPSTQLSGQVPAPAVTEPITVHYYDREQTDPEEQKMKQLSGYYITGEDLEESIEAVQQQLRALPAGTPVMMDVKSIYGNFYYSSAVRDDRNSDLDIAAVDALIQELCDGKYYAIARLPALRDKAYGLDHVYDGIPEPPGYLWWDEMTCYWLDPTRDGTQTYLIQLANELKSLGFDEVVFEDFYVPEHERIVFNHERDKALAEAAQIIVNSCATEQFIVSFTVDTYFNSPRGQSRMYLKDAAAADAEKLAAQFGFEEPHIRVVFLTQILDTRFDDYSVLRPISNAE